MNEFMSEENMFVQSVAPKPNKNKRLKIKRANSEWDNKLIAHNFLDKGKKLIEE